MGRRELLAAPKKKKKPRTAENLPGISFLVFDLFSKPPLPPPHGCKVEEWFNMQGGKKTTNIQTQPALAKRFPERRHRASVQTSFQAEPCGLGER